MRRLLPLLLLCFCAKPVDLKKEGARYDEYVAALPDLKPVDKAQALTLKIHYLEAENLPGLTHAERLQLYKELGLRAREIYGYTVTVVEIKNSKLADFFISVKDRFKNFPVAFPAHGFLISWFAPDRDQRVEDAVQAVWKKHDIVKIREYLGDVKDPAEATRAFTQKLARIYAEKDLTGRAVLSAENAGAEIYYSYGHWSSLLQGEKEADFFLTNAGILGADTGMPLYVIARGGVTSALVENNAYLPTQGAGVVGMYPFLAETPFFNEKRGVLTRQEKIECILWLWLHELGHLLLKKDENYSFADSVHRAPPDLRYYEWTKRVRASKNHHTAEIPATKKF